MTRLKAVVKHGRLVLDEPTDLPEGTVIELETIEEPTPTSVYEPVSLRDLDREPSGAPAPEQLAAQEGETPISLRSENAPARSVIARRHFSTLARVLSTHAKDTELAALVEEATKRSATHLKQLEDEPEGDNYLSNAREALVHAREALSLLQSASSTNPELVPAVEEAASAVGMIFSLLS